MNATPETAAPRGRFTGMLQIVAYNWPRYVAGAAVAIGAVVVCVAGVGPEWVRWGVAGGGAVAAWWTLASLVASHWIYDRSQLDRWTWVPSALGRTPHRWLNLHAGLDENTVALRNLLGGEGVTADFHDPAEMTEKSIERARTSSDAGGESELVVRHDALPFVDGAFDAVFVLFAAHELRRAASRERFFAEVRRVVARDGTVLLVEHVRDAMNFAAFGPGFLHFLPRAEWLRLAAHARLRVGSEFRMTPFVLVLTLQPEP